MTSLIARRVALAVALLVFGGCGAGSSSRLDHIALRGTRVTLGDSLSTGAAQLLEHDVSTAGMYLDQLHGTTTYLYRNDPRVKIVTKSSRVIVIMLASHRDEYLPTKGLTPGVALTDVRERVHGTVEGSFGQAPAVVKTTSRGAAYFIRDYDDSKRDCPILEKVGVIVLLARNSQPELAPESASVPCSSRD